MLDADLARDLRDAGLRWSPANGDWFVVPDRNLDDRLFTVSDMVVEVRDVATGGAVLAFNGTTEWALDSLEVAAAVWLPREDQLRELLGPRFQSLERLPPPAVGWAVTARGERYVGASAEAAYARALLPALPGATTGAGAGTSRP